MFTIPANPAHVRDAALEVLFIHGDQDSTGTDVVLTALQPAIPRAHAARYRRASPPGFDGRPSQERYGARRP